MELAIPGDSVPTLRDANPVTRAALQ